NIGQVDIEPNSRVRLVGTNETEHRLAMSRGRMRASINAPPRLFIVDTPSAVAVDLGCAYTLEVDDEGRGRLHVTDGWVALEAKGRESLVPAGAICETQPDKAPGTPYFDDVSPKFRAALAKLDAGGRDAKALNIILAEAREYDTLTLWHLLSRVEGAERQRVYERMAALIAPPAGVTRKGIMQLDKGMLELWKKELEWSWFE
ncbi:MAG: FecR domain-containing protein, partial [Pyrinomonadaceae bacterium]|nr:FecR domain-containing protein [Pyrinomonadaceae bacterium]